MMELFVEMRATRNKNTQRCGSYYVVVVFLVARCYCLSVVNVDLLSLFEWSVFFFRRFISIEKSGDF
jgi:hypothetical protein